MSLFEQSTKDDFNLGWVNYLKFWPWLYRKVRRKILERRLQKAAFETVVLQYPNSIMNQIISIQPMAENSKQLFEITFQEPEIKKLKKLFPHFGKYLHDGKLPNDK